MKFKMIDANEAPGLAKPVNKSRQIVTQMINELEPGKVAVITPEKDESIRGLKSTATRAGNREDRKVKAWDVDGRVYVRLVD